jgi:hypothetical protein
MRRVFHSQLAELWEVNPVLKRAAGLAIPASPYWTIEQHHSLPDNPEEAKAAVFNSNRKSDSIHLYKPTDKHGKSFVPLVRDSMSLMCSLDTLFLRKQEPGKIVQQGGDLDNRLKTLIDGLRMPMYIEEMNEAGDVPEPMYCLLESDTLISKLSVKTDRLLTAPGGSCKEARLVINVSLRALRVASYNLPMLGD